MKNMKLLYSKEFLNDLTNAIEYIQRDSPQAAKSFARKIHDKIKLLKKNPEIGKALEEVGLTGFRLLIIGNYLVLYEIQLDENLVYLHGFCHGARDYPMIYRNLNK